MESNAFKASNSSKLTQVDEEKLIASDELEKSREKNLSLCAQRPYKVKNNETLNFNYAIINSQ